MKRAPKTGYCSSCGQQRPFKHTHQLAQGVAGTHMAGSERFECLVCDEAYGIEDGPPSPLQFIFDKLPDQGESK